MNGIRKIPLYVTLGIVLGVFYSQTALGLSSEQNQVFRNGIHYFNTELDQQCAVVVDANLIGSDNIEKAYRYFVGKGLTDFQAAAIVGNLVQESHVVPTAQQDGSSTPYPKPNVGFGIAQWTTAGRQQNLVDLAQKANQPVTSLGVQLDFLWQELQGGYKSTLTKLQASTEVVQATTILEEGYEAAGQPEMPKRISYAQGVLQKYGGSGNNTGTISTASSTTSSCNATGPGQNTQYIDGFTVYSQYDPQWKNNPYGTSTIGDSGCGPSAMAMIVTALTGNRVTPADTTTYANTQNLYIPGAGSSWSIAPNLASHYGLKAKAIGADAGKITAALQSGALVIGSGKGAEPFTSAGHYIVIRGVTADGKWKVGDSAHSTTSSLNWDPNQIIASMVNSSGSVYAISK